MRDCCARRSRGSSWSRPRSRSSEIDALDHFNARDFAREVPHPELGRSVRYPGAFARLPASPLSGDRRAPRLGEHTAEVLAELRPPRLLRREAGARVRPLEGVKMLDLFWVMAGPAATRVLADYGATVVHVESTRRVDTLRAVPPFKDNVPLPDDRLSSPRAGSAGGCRRRSVWRHPRAGWRPRVWPRRGRVGESFENEPVEIRFRFGVAQVERAELVDDDLRHHEVAVPLAVGGDDVPRRVLGAAVASSASS